MKTNTSPQASFPEALEDELTDVVNQLGRSGKDE